MSSEQSSIKDIESLALEVVDTLEQTRKREQAIADCGPELLLAVDESGIVIEANSSVTHILKRHPIELVSSPLLKLIPDDDARSISESLRACKQSLKPHEVTTGARGGRGLHKSIRWRIEYSPALKCHFLAGEDVTEQMKVEQFKRDFTSMVVHDLRTPLSSVVLSVDLLLHAPENTLDSDQRSLLDRSQRSLKRLLQLINSLLDVQKLEAGKFKLNLKLVRIRELFNEAESAVRAFAAAKRISIESKGDIDAKIPCDDERLLQVLINLLSNAIKYSPSESIIELRAKTGSRATTIVVKDSGSGIPEGHRQKIFDRFEQVETTEKKGTSGLGLYVCKAIVESHGGNIGVRSSEGQGSEFWFTLPALEDSDAL